MATQRPHARNIRADFLERLRREWREGMTRGDLAQALSMKVPALDQMLNRCRKDGDLPVSHRAGQHFDPLGKSSPSWATGIKLYPSTGRQASGNRALTHAALRGGATVPRRGPWIDSQTGRY